MRLWFAKEHAKGATTNFFGVKKAQWQEVKVTYTIPKMERSKRFEWTSDDTPWWFSRCGRNLAGCCCCSPCWLYKVQKRMALQNFYFDKEVSGFGKNEKEPSGPEKEKKGMRGKKGRGKGKEQASGAPQGSEMARV